MVERSLSMREVRGSIPRCSNSFLDFFPLRRPPRWEVCCWSRGLLAHSDVRATGNGADRVIAARGREARVYIHRLPPRASRLSAFHATRTDEYERTDTVGVSTSLGSLESVDTAVALLQAPAPFLFDACRQ